MKIKMSNILTETILDWKHWLGWIITLLAIILIFHFLGVRGLYKPFYNIFILLGIIVIIDFIKHLIKLQ